MWRETELQITTGQEDVLLLNHIMLPCEGGASLYSDPRLPQRFNVTRKFDIWCESFLTDIVTNGMMGFCPDTPIRLSKLAEHLSHKMRS